MKHTKVLLTKKKNSSHRIKKKISTLHPARVTKYVHTLTLFPRKPHPTPDQTGQNLYPFLDQKDAKTLLVGAADTYMAYLRATPRGT